MKWNGRYYRPGFGIPVYTKKEESIEDLLKPLGEKKDKGNVWRPILNQPINVLKEDLVPSPTPTSTSTPTPTQTPTQSSTSTPTPTLTSTPTPTQSSTSTPTPTSSSTPTPTPTLTMTPTPTSIVFEAEYQAVLNKANLESYILPSFSQQIIQNQLVIDLKTAGIWAALDAFYVLACDAASQNFTSLNWKAPATAFQMGYVNSPQYVLNKGMKGDGISSYLTTGISLSGLNSTPSANYKSTNASRFAWIFTGTTDASKAIDIGNNGWSFICLANTAGQRVNTTLNLTANLDFTGLDRLKYLSRVGSSTCPFQNGATQDTRFISSPASVSLDTDLTLLGRGAGNFSDVGISIYGLGAPVDRTTLNTILTTYMNSI